MLMTYLLSTGSCPRPRSNTSHAVHQWMALEVAKFTSPLAVSVPFAEMLPVRFQEVPRSCFQLPFWQHYGLFSTTVVLTWKKVLCGSVQSLMSEDITPNWLESVVLAARFPISKSPLFAPFHIELSVFFGGKWEVCVFLSLILFQQLNRAIAFVFYLCFGVNPYSSGDVNGDPLQWVKHIFGGFVEQLLTRFYFSMKQKIQPVTIILQYIMHSNVFVLFCKIMCVIYIYKHKPVSVL